jgi:hypothetical protein
MIVFNNVVADYLNLLLKSETSDSGRWLQNNKPGELCLLRRVYCYQHVGLLLHLIPVNITRQITFTINAFQYGSVASFAIGVKELK